MDSYPGSYFHPVYQLIVYWATFVEDAAGNVLYQGRGWSPSTRYFTSKSTGSRHDGLGDPPFPCNVWTRGGRCGCNHWSRDCPFGENSLAVLARAGRPRNAPAAAPAAEPDLAAMFGDLGLNNAGDLGLNNAAAEDEEAVGEEEVEAAEEEVEAAEEEVEAAEEEVEAAEEEVEAAEEEVEAAADGDSDSDDSEGGGVKVYS